MMTKKITLPVTIAAVASVFAVGGAVAFGVTPSKDDTVANEARAASQGQSDPIDAKLARDCVQATIARGVDVPEPGSWRPAAKMDVDTPHGVLIIRNAKAAVVCLIDNGKATGIMAADSHFDGSTGQRHTYRKLTASRPFDYFDALNNSTESIQFGIASDGVTAVKLVAPDGSETAAVVKEGTFIAKTKYAEDSNQATTNHVRATLTDGTVIEGPLRG
ncbi:hypothetical protein GCM10010174_86770 [Kutzneria viridogrisea]|uniref:Uncharacterized protein n=2 Tax=Kutzneria viridogrisea TaxID=47990 RepID=A0ABR6BS66_9PSEU|nr:hypothetical protein [Kutzneria viridogrisea]